MAIAAKSVKSIKKQDITSRFPSFGHKNLLIGHEAGAGETSINLAALSLPSDHPVNQPSIDQMLLARIQAFKENVTILSSDKGLLQQGSGKDYSIASNTLINLNFSTVAGEVFHIAVKNVIQSLEIDTDLKEGIMTSNSVSASKTVPSGKTLTHPNLALGAGVTYTINGSLLTNSIDLTDGVLDLTNGNLEFF